MTTILNWTTINGHCLLFIAFKLLSTAERKPHQMHVSKVLVLAHTRNHNGERLFLCNHQYTIYYQIVWFHVPSCLPRLRHKEKRQPDERQHKTLADFCDVADFFVSKNCKQNVLCAVIGSKHTHFGWVSEIISWSIRTVCVLHTQKNTVHVVYVHISFCLMKFVSRNLYER